MWKFIRKLMQLKGEVGGVTGFSLSDGKDSMSVPSTSTYYTNAVPVGKSIYFGLWLKATSAAGSPSLQIDIEQSYTKPTTENASDSNWVIADGASAVYANLNDEVAHVIQVTPCPMTYLRLKITGLSGNHATDTKLVAKLFTQSIA